MEDERAFLKTLKAASLPELLSLYRSIDRVQYPERIQRVLQEIQARDDLQAPQAEQAEESSPQQADEGQEQESMSFQSDEFQQQEDISFQDDPVLDTSPQSPPQDDVFIHDNRLREAEKRQITAASQRQRDTHTLAPSRHAHTREKRKTQTSPHDVAYDDIHTMQHDDTSYHTPSESRTVRHDSHSHSQQKRLPRRRKQADVVSFMVLLFGGGLYYLAFSLIRDRFYEDGSGAMTVIMVSTLVSAGVCILVNNRIRDFGKAIGFSLLMALFVPAAFGMAIMWIGGGESFLGVSLRDSSLVPSFISIAVSVAIIMASLFHIRRRY